MGYKLLVINPGSTSTKIAVYEDTKEIFEETLRHQAEEIAKYATIADQLEKVYDRCNKNEKNNM